MYSRFIDTEQCPKVSTECTFIMDLTDHNTTRGQYNINVVSDHGLNHFMDCGDVLKFKLLYMGYIIIEFH